MSYISNKFVRNILQEPPKWGPIGQIVYLRTYSRWLQDQQRRERWDETVKRVVNYSVDLDPIMDKGEKIIEAERLFETIYKMRAFPSGRTMWVGGTEHSATNGQSMFNCAYTDVTSVVTLHDIVVLLMNGVGVGVGVRSDEVAQFKSQGKLNLSNVVIMKDYEYVGTPGTGGDQYTHNNAKHFTIHDSREGWAEFVRDFVYTYLFGEEESIYINVDHIRPEGTPLKTFGGRASGPQALIDFVNGFIQAVSDNDGINDIVLLDTVNLLGRMVVSGGVRRSALAMLGDATSQDFINAKTGDYYEKYPWRGQANNSVVFYERPSVETIRSYFPAILQYGEPGFVNGQAAKNIRADWKGFNPCFEILLSDSGVCNLVSINFKYFAENQDEMHMFEETVRVIVRHNLRITNTTFNGVDPKWDLTQKRDRLLGVSFTGYGDAVDILGSEKPLQMLERMKQLVHDTAYEYADKMGIPRPLLSTTVKPEGSITLLYGASSGIHDVYAPYYIRRVRMGRTDALSVTLEQLGVPVEDDKFTPGLVVFSFPIKSAAIKSAGSKSAIEQLERYKDIMQTYVDHNASNTIYMSKDEVEEVSQWVYDNWDTYIAVSFLPKMDSKYEQAPMEEIDEETYNKLAAQMPDLSDLHARLAEVEYEMSAGDELEGCETSGSCPIR